MALKLKLFAFGIGFLSIVDGNSPKAVPHDQLSEVINFSDQSLFSKWGEQFFEVVCGIVCRKIRISISYSNMTSDVEYQFKVSKIGMIFAFFKLGLFLQNT